MPSKTEEKLKSRIAVLFFIAGLVAFFIGLELVAVLTEPSQSMKIFYASLASILILVFLVVYAKLNKLEQFKDNAEKLKKETKEMLYLEIKKYKDARWLALLILQFLFALICIVGFAALLDPSWEIIHWQKIGINDNFTKTILNAIVGLLIIFAFIWLYNFTKTFRISTTTLKKKN